MSFTFFLRKSYSPCSSQFLHESIRESCLHLSFLIRHSSYIVLHYSVWSACKSHSIATAGSAESSIVSQFPFSNLKYSSSVSLNSRSLWKLLSNILLMLISSQCYIRTNLPHVIWEILIFSGAWYLTRAIQSVPTGWKNNFILEQLRGGYRTEFSHY